MKLEAALAEALEAKLAGTWVCIGGEAEVDPEDWVGAELPLRAWDTRRRAQGLAPEISVGLGEAARVGSAGAARFSEVKRACEAVFERVARVGDAQPRFFGGFAFDADRLGAFAPLGAAAFALPRWTATRSAGRTHVELCVRVEELAEPSRLLREVALRLTPRRREVKAGAARVIQDGAKDFLHSTALALGAIEREALDKVVVVRQLAARGELSLESAWLRLAAEPNATRFALAERGVAFVGATPELLLRCDGTRVESEAVAGTAARRGATPLSDAAEAQALEADDKESREHAFVVHDIVDALARVGVEARAGARGVRTLGRAHHLVTPIEARGSVHILDLLSVLHPTPAISGVPRDAAQRWLRDHERVERGWFSGPVGWIDAAGRGEFVVALRSALLVGDRAWAFAGAGIVRGSRAERELAETELKLQSMRSALGIGSPPAARASRPLGGAP